MKYNVQETRYGFDYGPARIERTASGETWGVVISVKGRREVAEVRITPSGLVRMTKRRASGWEKERAEP